MSAKFDVLKRSIVSDFFKTPYFAWMDIGLFRKMDSQDQGWFKLVPPEKFNPERIGMSQVWPQDPQLPLERIMKEKAVWVSGGMIVATKEVCYFIVKSYNVI